MDKWEMEKKVIVKALKDPEFKKNLLANPKKAVKECLKNEKNIDLSSLDQINVKIHEEKKGEWTISMPHLDSNRVLSDGELQTLFAAGGVFTQSTGQSCCCTTSVGCPL